MIKEKFSLLIIIINNTCSDAPRFDNNLLTDFTETPPGVAVRKVSKLTKSTTLNAGYNTARSGSRRTCVVQVVIDRQ
jgi:hypothetical protein